MRKNGNSHLGKNAGRFGLRIIGLEYQRQGSISSTGTPELKMIACEKCQNFHLASANIGIDIQVRPALGVKWKVCNFFLNMVRSIIAGTSLPSLRFCWSQTG